MTDTTPSARHDGDDLEPAAANTGSQLRAIIESLADGIVIVDAGGSIRFANPAAARLFNRSHEALVGTMLGLPVIVGETTEMEIVRRGGGEEVHAELRTVNTTWEGEVVQLVSLRDVTDRKNAEERAIQLVHEREARLQAEAASRTKSDFLAIMSHELRTPLNAILGYSELIELGVTGDVSAGMLEQITRIRISAKHLLGLVNDILDLAKVEAGRLSVASTPANVTEAVASALTLVQPLAAVRNLELVVVPGAEGLPAYIGDAERVTQILVNLLSNAVKCTAPGGSISIGGIVTTDTDPRARLKQRHPYIRLSVSDTGIGIPREKLAAIFEPFVQGDSGPRRTHEGSGLGLTIGQRLAHAMGGDLTVESTLGEGSTFHLWIPADDSARTRDDAEAVEQGEADAPARALRTPGPRSDLRGLGEIAHGILRELDPLVTTVVGRLRCDAVIPMAAGLRTSQVTDHLSTLLADIAGAIIVLEEVAGEPSPLLADAMEIQRLVSERHGAQRARLGWTEAAIRREFMIVREELERVVKRSLPASGPLQLADALAAVNRFVDQAEYIGVRRLEKDKMP